MPDQTIDAIKVRLGVDGAGIKAGVEEANAQLNKLGTTKRSVAVEVRPVLQTGTLALTKYLNELKKTHKVPIEVDIQQRGELGIGNVRKKIQEGLKAGGGVNIPIKVGLSAAEATKVRSQIRKDIGIVSIDFDWVAKGPPKYDGVVSVDWDWGNGPDGSPSSGGGRGRGPRRTPPSPPPAPAAGPPESSGGFTAGRQAGESRAQASARHKAEHEAERAKEKTAREQKKTAEGDLAATKKQQQAQREATSTGTSSTTPGPQGQATRRAQKSAEKATQEAAKTTEEAAKATTVTAKRQRTERQKQLDASIRESRSVLKFADGQIADARTPNKKAKYESIARVERQNIEKTEKLRKDEAARIRAEERAAQAAPAATPAAGPIGGVGRRTREPAKPRAARGAPASGGTTSQTTATEVPSAGGPRLGPDELRGGKKAKGHNFRGSGNGPRGWGPEGEPLPGEEGVEGNRIMAARRSRTMGANEAKAQFEHKAELRANISPEMESAFKEGGVEGIFPEAEQLFEESDPIRRRTLAHNFRLRHSGHGGQLRDEDTGLPRTDPGGVVTMDKNRMKQMRKLRRRVHSLGPSADVGLVADLLGGQAGWENAVDAWGGAVANKVSDAAGGGIKGERTGAPKIAKVRAAVGGSVDPGTPRAKMSEDERKAWDAQTQRGIYERQSNVGRESLKKAIANAEVGPIGSWQTLASRPKAEYGTNFPKPLNWGTGGESRPLTDREQAIRAGLAERTAAMEAGRAQVSGQAELTRLIKSGVGATSVSDPRFRTALEAFRGAHGSLPIDEQLAKARGIYKPFTAAVTADAPVRAPKVRRTKNAPIDLTEAAGKLSGLGRVIRDDDIQKFAEGGLYSRSIGHKFAMGDSQRSMASQNTGEWKKIRGAHLRANPYCKHCGIDRTEARKFGRRLSVDAIISEAQGGSHTDPSNLQTLCTSCNSRKSGFSHQPDELWNNPRPRGLLDHPKLNASPEDFLPGGRFFGVLSLRQALKRRAEGGLVNFRDPKVIASLPERSREIARSADKKFCGKCGKNDHATYEHDTKVQKRAEGGELPEFKSLSEIRGAAKTAGVPLFTRWTPDLSRDMRPGKVSHNLGSKSLRESGVSAGRLDLSKPHLGIDRQYDLGGMPSSRRTWYRGRKKFSPRDLYLLGGKQVGEGIDGEPTLESTSMYPLGRISREAVEEAEERNPWGKTRNRPANIQKRADGGAWVKHGGLLERMAQAGHDPSITLLGERGPELAVTDPNTGQSEIVPTHKVPTWLQRAREGKGVAKDMTYRAGGGRFRGRLMAEPGSGMRGRKVYRQGFEGERESIAAGQLSSTGGIQRVFVVNWPPPVAIGAPAGVAAGPVRPNQPPPQPPPQPQPQTPPQPQPGAAAGLAGVLNAAAGRPGSAIRAAKGTPASPFATAQARISSRATADQIRDELADIRSNISEAQSLSPVRALSVSVGQIFANTIGGRAGIIKRAGAASAKTAQATRALGDFEASDIAIKKSGAELKSWINLRRQNNNQWTPEEQKSVDELTEKIKSQTKARQANRDAMVKAKDEARSSSENVISFGGALRNITASMIGVTAGTLAFSAAFNAANMAMSVGMDVAGKWVERATGFQNIAGQTTGALSDQTVQMAGYSRAAVSAAEAASGMSAAQAGMIQPLVEQRVAGEAANKNLLSQIDLLHTSEAIKAQYPETPGGTRLPGDKSTYQTTGGLFGTIINGIPSTAEMVGNELAGVPTTQGKADEGFLGLFPNATAEINKLTKGKEIWEARRDSGEISDKDLKSNYNYKEIIRKLAEVGQGDMGQGRIDFFNDAMVSGGQSVTKFARQTDEITESQRSQMAAAAYEGGAFGVGQQIEAGKVMLVDPQGRPVFDAKQYTAAMGAIQQSGKYQDPQVYMQRMLGQQGFMGPMQVQMRANRRQGTFERESAVPAGVAMKYAAQPLIAYNDPRLRPSSNAIPGVPGSGKGFAAQQQQYTDAFKKYEKYGLSAQSAINAEISKGEQVLRDWGVPDSMISDIKTVGTAIQDIQLGLEQRGLNLTVAQYNNELRIASRSLNDAKDLQAGIGGEAKKTLGGYEGQNIALGRQLQLLEQSMAQRQINFKLAMAGFTAPGDTPEQRQARIDEAKLEAAYAQKQLDIQKKMSANQFSVVKISAGRSITDLSAQISLLTEGKSLAIDTYAAQKAISDLTAQEDILLEKAQSRVTEGQKAAGIWMQAVTDFESATGKAFDKISPEFNKIFEDAGYNFAKAIADAINPSNYDIPRSNAAGVAASTGIPRLPSNASGPRRDAPGGIGSFATPTSFTVGEAGSETVAILRNPRIGSFPMGGGGGAGTFNFNINISGGGDIDQKKLDTWARDITRQVENSLNRKTSLLGLRNP